MIGAIFKFIVLFVIILLVMRVFFRLMYPRPPKHLLERMHKRSLQDQSTQADQAGLNSSEQPAAVRSAQADTMLTCAVCGTLVSEADAIIKADRAFCSLAHLSEFLAQQDDKKPM